MYSNPDEANKLTWHKFGQKNDGLLRHPADSLQWRLVDEKWSDFGREERNLCLAMSTDGMNPYGSLSSRHSTWPVMLAIYNLPPSLCMKRKYIILSLIIPGPTQPGNDICVYLAPLIDDLLLLCESGVEVFDANRKETSNLRALLFCTIQNFPAYGNLSGYSVKGTAPCPICEDNWKGEYMKGSHKTVYFDHRPFLPCDHCYRRMKKAFNGKQEFNCQPHVSTGLKVYERVKDIQTTFGKLKKNRNALPKQGYKKCSEFWRLSYWKHLFVRHCLEKAELCASLAGVKVPEGFSSNISSLVSMQNLKLVGFKSHDCHVLMQYLLPVAIRSILPKNVRYSIIRLCSFFNAIYSKVFRPSDLDSMETEIVVILCQLEMYFPPAFFDIMVHLPIHLVREIKYCGPVHMRSSWPFKRQMKTYKDYVKNFSRPEACIAERMVYELAIEFSMDLLGDMKTIGVPKSRHCG
ncbi:uncharacterized protein LOC110715131 [Chenopodium quinoa]|uniref:uncharacterized protein LOC110715131 n=1 Tax=Chenopodium quinoa TaxID=63459 RepID=UPI000B77244A|nr:uncharacterized protein LOC110715131 [Chenopodium quinoa]